MKTFDIRKIYVCQIQVVNNLFEEQTDEDEIVCLNGRRLAIGKKTQRFYELDESDIYYGLFVKGLTGYKHILTGTKYKEATNPSITIGEHVINPKYTELLAKRERALVSYAINQCKTYDMDISAIQEIEERINTPKHLVKDEDTASKEL
ncbi:MAG: hypothetical protein IJ371_04970 [Clostridia bacterium]|nr:hypothetical protein [Clostridia bacterium]